MVSTLATIGHGYSRFNQNTIESVRLTPTQREWLSIDSPFAVWRDANQVGKSWTQAFDAVAYCRGVHPAQLHKPPVRVVVIGTSWEQMEPLMQKIWMMAPKPELDSRCGFEAGRGITGKPPRLKFSAGPGSGSLIQFATYRQGTGRIAGGTIHRVICDEPSPEHIIGELRPRVFRHRGAIRLGFTPTPDSPPQKWLKDMCDEGTAYELNKGLRESSCWPDGNPSPWLFQHEIDEYERGLLHHEREMRMGRSWFATVSGAWMKDFGDDNIRLFGLNDLQGAWLMVGIDHGTADGKQVCMLLAVENRYSHRPRVWWMDERTAGGLTRSEDDAEIVLDMLRDNGLTYDHVDEWVGDRPMGSKKHDITKGNKELRREMASQLKRPLHKTKPIYHPKKGAGSLTEGMRLLNAIMGRRDDEGLPHGIVHPRCKEFIKGCREFNGHPQHPQKDPLDAGRYPVERACHSGAGVQMNARY